MANTLKLEIQAANDKFMAAFGNGDSDGVGKLYTQGCKVMPTGADVMFGRDAAAAVFKSVMDAGAASVVLSIDEVGPMGDGDIAFERSHYTKYVVIWKRILGVWYLDIDIFNSNAAS